MSATVHLLSVSYSVEYTTDSSSKSSTMQPLQLTDTTPPRSPKPQKSWNYVRTPVRAKSPASPSAPSRSTSNSTTTVSYKEEYISVNCFVYYEEKGKLRRKLVMAEMKSDTLIGEAIRRLASYCSSLKKLSKNYGRVYRSANIMYQDFQEVHATQDAANPLSAYDSHYFAFDTTGYVAKKIPVRLESYPLWCM